MYYNTSAIIIKKTKLSDTDLILTLFTKKFGKITVIAKGARNPKSRLSSVSQIFVYGDFNLNISSKWSKINSFEINESHYKLREDIVRLAYASYITELINIVILDNSPNIRLFELFENALNSINNLENINFELLKAVFEFKMLDYIGYKMHVNSCIECLEKTEKWYISLKEGGTICENCKNKFTNLIYVGKKLPYIIDYIFRHDIDEILKIEVNDRYIKALSKISYDFLKLQLGREKFKSIDFLNSVK